MIRRRPFILGASAFLLAACSTPPAAPTPAKPAETKPAEAKPTTAPAAASPATGASPAASPAAKPAASPGASPVASPAASPAAVAPTAAPAAAKPSAPAAPVGSTRVAFFDVVYNAPLYAAMERGFWKNAGLDVEFIQTRSGQLSQVALQSGQADFSVVGVESLMNLREQGGRDIVGVWSLLNRLTLNVVVGTDVLAQKGVSRQSPLKERYAALKGLTIGITSPGAVSEVYMRYYMRQAGLDPERDANFVAIGDATALLAALKTKQVQAYMLSAPTPQFAENEGFGSILIKASEGDVPEFANYAYVFYCGNREYMEKNPAITRAFVKGLNNSRDWLLNPSNRGEFNTVMKKYFGSMSDEVLRLSIDDTLPSITKDGKFVEATMRSTLDIVADTGQIKPEWKDQSAADGRWWTNKFHE